MSISVPLTFLAGLLSFLSPCVLPLVPAYVGYLSGSTLEPTADVPRRRVLSHALCFVAGFTLVFVILFGLPATLLGTLFQDMSRWIARVGGVFVILFGLHTLRVISIPALNMTRRVEMRQDMAPGYVRSWLFGATFASGWTPCIGPLLGTVITLAFAEPSRAVGYVLIYAFGLAVPFLLTAALLARGISLFQRLNRHLRTVEVVSGVLMVGVGALLVTGMFTVLNGYFIRMTPEWLIRYL